MEKRAKYVIDDRLYKLPYRYNFKTAQIVLY